MEIKMERRRKLLNTTKIIAKAIGRILGYIITPFVYLFGGRKACLKVVNKINKLSLKLKQKNEA